MTDIADRIVMLLGDIVAIPSAYPPGNTVALADYLKAVFEKIGYRVGLHAEVDGLVNVVASIGSGSPHLVFNAHIDTVDVEDRASWKTDPFRLTDVDGRLYGLGASNCKGSAAVHIWLAEEIARRGGPKQGTVTFTFVTDEESLGEHGMAFLRKAGIVSPDMLCFGAPTSNTLITSERGVMWVAIEALGKAGHAGAPQSGDNAIQRMLRLISHLDETLFPVIATRTEDGAVSTCNLGKISGGSNTNVVPSRCRIELDRRLLPGETVTGAYREIVDALEKSGEPHEKWSANLLCGTNGFASEKNGRMISALLEAVQEVTGKDPHFSSAVGASDGRWFADDGVEIVNFGPGGAFEGHADNEFISEIELIESARIHLLFVERLHGLR
ncbi:ArgE/DapE family deacylase [Ochrobactrum sp. CM-21-5]|nr:ArgE/DapE family deacylase [Ochrobactrum sp. CM-21-5]MBC2886292.1 ArgE/DapE family deacylase [Ochrobactrum sp. CM-21-5]